VIETTRIVEVVASSGSSLGAALRAGLDERGWTTVRRYVPEASLALAGHGVVVVMEDDAGRALAPYRPRGRADHWVWVGSLRTSDELAALAAGGAVVLNQDVPFLPLVASVERALANSPYVQPRSTAQVSAAIRARSAEAAALARLTERERAVLCGMIHGRNAHRIAEDGSRAVTTVRSQIQAVLRRLGVSSQLSAVAIAQRSGAQGALAPCLEAHHQF
jgi:DNA-binding NarL/FixJ family response regulator